MNSRERFRRTMAYGRPDRVPYFEEGIRDDVLEAWRRQGLADDAQLDRLFPTDRHEEIAPELDPTPSPRQWPGTAAELDDLRARLDPDDPGRLPDSWQTDVERWRDRDHVLLLRVHRGFFLTMGVHDWQRFLEVMYLVRDDPGLVRAWLELQSEMATRLATRILDDVDVDAVVFSEPIGGNDRPLLGPDDYAGLVLPTYRPLIEACRARGVETVVFRTYANARVLLPAVLDAGFDCLWACEVEAEAMDYRALRAEHGRRLRLIGGIDLDVLHRDEDAIRGELERVLPPLLEDGGYVPLADGRVRPDVPWSRYRFYRELLAEMAGGVRRET